MGVIMNLEYCKQEQEKKEGQGMLSSCTPALFLTPLYKLWQ